MKNVVIIIKGGMVQRVLSQDADISVTVLDLDELNPKKLDEKVDQYAKLNADNSYTDIL